MFHALKIIELADHKSLSNKQLRDELKKIREFTEHNHGRLAQPLNGHVSGTRSGAFFLIWGLLEDLFIRLQVGIVVPI